MGAIGLASIALAGGGILNASVGQNWNQLIRYGTFVFNGLIAPLFCPPHVELEEEHQVVLDRD
jgi:hypothetical protein